jgi:pimeloyl-ACP methyl ester carboxylesterase
MSWIQKTAAPVRDRLRARAPHNPAPLFAAGAALVAAVVANHLAARRIERRYPAEGKFISVDGVRLHYLEQGEGPPLVLIHGNAVSAEDFRLSGMLDRLAQTHRVIAFDRPGYGYSERPRSKLWTARAQALHLLAALDALGVQKPLVVGHSWGTLVALNMVLEQPDDVGGLVLMSGYYWPTLRLDAPVAGWLAVPLVGDIMRYTVSPLFGRLNAPLVLEAMFAPAKVPAVFAHWFKGGMALRPSQLRASGADGALMPIEAARIAGRLTEIRALALVMAGTGDKVVNFEANTARLARELLGGQVHAVEGAGHMAHHTATEEMLAAIAAFEIQLRPAAGPEGLREIDTQG